MNYYGKTVSNKVPENLYSFLKEALQKVEGDKPFRGPTEFNKGTFRYAVNVEGDITQFSGEETIHYEDNLVFTLKFHGGNVSSRD